MAKEVSTFRLPSEYERQAAEARRRRRMAEMLAQQAYQPQDVGVAPIPAAAPFVQGLQAFLEKRQLRKAEEAEEKARQADVESAQELLRQLNPQQRSGAEEAVAQMAQSAQPGQLSADGTYTPSTITPGTAPIGMPYTQAAPTGAERDQLLYGAMASGSPRAAQLAQLLMSQKQDREEEFGTQPVLSESGEYVLFGKGGTVKPTGVRGKVEAPPGMSEYQRGMLGLREREIGLRERASQPGTRPLSPTSQKELFETDENILSTQTGIGLLKNALDLSPKAFEGVAANQRAYAATALPDAVEPAGAKETLEFDLLIKQQVLPQLRSIFGAAPTEGERAILLELQGSSNLPRKTRENLLTRAIDSANRRLEFNRQKAEQIRSGKYFTEGPTQPTGLPPGFDLE